MAKHEVTVDMPPRPLQRQDVTFQVKQDGAVLGTLKISNGSLVWFPKGTTYGRKIGWKRFDELMDEHAPKEEIR